jgi:tetratricopeptide (TPR) repeat protein
MKNVLALQSDVALAIAGEIQVVLTPEESARLESVREVNPDAYRAYLHGLTDWNLRDEGDLRTALGYFRQAIDIDPGFAQARAGLANTYIVMGHWGYEPLELAFRLAESEARKALEIDPNLGEAYAALASIVHLRDLDVPEARRLFQRSIELSPGYASAHQWLGELEFDVANFDASLAAYERAIALAPTSLIIRLGHAGAVAVVRGCEEAFALWEGVDADYPDAGAPKAFASSIALVCGDYDRMARETVAYNMFFQWTPAQQQSLERAWDDGGLRAFSETAARFCEEHVLAGGYVPTGFILTLYAAAQNWDAVFANLDKTYAEAGPWVFTPLILTQLFEPIADDPRYQAYVARLTGAE